MLRCAGLPTADWNSDALLHTVGQIVGKNSWQNAKSCPQACRFECSRRLRRSTSREQRGLSVRLSLCSEALHRAALVDRWVDAVSSGWKFGGSEGSFETALPFCRQMHGFGVTVQFTTGVGVKQSVVWCGNYGVYQCFAKSRTSNSEMFTQVNLLYPTFCGVSKGAQLYLNLTLTWSILSEVKPVFQPSHAAQENRCPYETMS